MIYDYAYDEATGSYGADWRPHLRVYATAQKYLLLEVQEKALQTIESLTKGIKDAGELVAAICAMRDDTNEVPDREDCHTIANKLMLSNFKLLSGDDGFRKRMEVDHTLLRLYTEHVYSSFQELWIV